MIPTVKLQTSFYSRHLLIFVLLCRCCDPLRVTSVLCLFPRPYHSVSLHMPTIPCPVPTFSRFAWPKPAYVRNPYLACELLDASGCDVLPLSPGYRLDADGLELRLAAGAPSRVCHSLFWSRTSKLRILMSRRCRP